VEKVRREVARHAEFAAVYEQITEVNEKIWEARPPAGTDPGYRGPRAPCGQGHEAGFVSYRDKTFDTVPGPVTVKPRLVSLPGLQARLRAARAELGIAGASLSPGLAAMNDRAAAAGPFAQAAWLLEDLAGIRLDVKRVERAAEASGAAQAAAVRERARLISDRKLVPLPPSPVPDMLYGAVDGARTAQPAT
jgi:hypothetical protein